MSEAIYCAIDCCSLVATSMTSNNMPLCADHARVYEMGQENPEPLKDIEYDGEIS